MCIQLTHRNFLHAPLGQGTCSLPNLKHEQSGVTSPLLFGDVVRTLRVVVHFVPMCVRNDPLPLNTHFQRLRQFINWEAFLAKLSVLTLLVGTSRLLHRISLPVRHQGLQLSVK